jgi:hypothetical protein
MIITFYNEIISQHVVDLQKKVFEKFRLEINQIKPETWINHGTCIDNFLNEVTNENEVIVLFDIDSIPLNDWIVPYAEKWCSENLGIFSVAQKSPKLTSTILAAPSFMVFSKKTYDYLGRPSFVETERSDCGGEMTYAAREKGLEVRLLYPTSSEIPAWHLDQYYDFGYGTNYENKIYHSFESRFKKKDSYFINKCNEILNNG